MPGEIQINPRVVIPLAEVSFTTSRASGPGGQHVNTTESRVQLRWNLPATSALGPIQKSRVQAALASRLTESGDLILASDTHRSQHRNREEVIQRFAEILRQALIPPRPRKKTRPTRASRERRLQDKKRMSQIKKGRGKPRQDD